MKLLIIDTSTEKSLVAFANGIDLLLTKALPVGLQSSRYLLSAVDAGFKELMMSPECLDAIAVTVGPGSFTGIRVGVAVAKGISFAQSIPLIDLCSLSGFISPNEGRFVSMIDAKSSGAYLLHQERCGEEIKELFPPELVSKEKLSHELKKEWEVVGPVDMYPDAGHLAKIASNKFLQKAYADDLNLHYLR